jgi:hypothetical protein
LEGSAGVTPEVDFARAPDDADAWRVVATFPDGTAAGFEVLTDGRGSSWPLSPMGSSRPSSNVSAWRSLLVPGTSTR